MMQELTLRVKVDRDFNSFNDFEFFMIEQVREGILERIAGYSTKYLDEGYYSVTSPPFDGVITGDPVN